MQEMETNTIEYLYQISERKIASVNVSFHRYLYSQINWENRLIGIKGCKGVGKTTLVLQHIKETFNDYSKALFISMDNLWFETNSVLDLVEYHYTHGGSHIFFDEIHHCKSWQTLLKNLYDDYPSLKFCYTGSSMLRIDIQGKDLSRRQRVYTLERLSFREYLAMENLVDVQPFSLEELLSNHSSIASSITSRIKILPAFSKYLKFGCYPFYKEEGDGYLLRLQDTVRITLENDLLQVTEISYATVQKIKQMLMILAEKVPQTPNMVRLYAELETNREQGLKMLYLLNQAGLISILTKESKSLKHLPKPDKIYLGDSNLMYALTARVDIGTLRETFFHSQLAPQHSIMLPDYGDFKIDNELLFEIGGKGKNFDQIKDIPKSYLAIDDLEIGNHNRIPLWMFGLLY